jgi:hypothetical protein
VVQNHPYPFLSCIGPAHVAWGVATGGEWQWRGQKRKREIKSNWQRDTTERDLALVILIYLLCFVFSIHNSWTSLFLLFLEAVDILAFSPRHKISSNFSRVGYCPFIWISLSLSELSLVLPPLPWCKHCSCYSPMSFLPTAWYYWFFTSLLLLSVHKKAYLWDTLNRITRPNPISGFGTFP